MEKQALTMLGAFVVVAAVVAAGTSYLVATSVAPMVPDAAKPAGPPANATVGPNGTRSNVTAPPNATAPPSPSNETPIWTFLARPAPQGPNATGSVIVLLAKLQGDLNTSSANGSIPVEVAGVRWQAFRVTPPANGTILQAMNTAFTQSPPVALTRAALSRNGDAVELTVPPGMNITSVIVNAPATGEFLVIDWPTGQPYGWAPQRSQWIEITEGPAQILARPLALSSSSSP